MNRDISSHGTARFAVLITIAVVLSIAALANAGAESLAFPLQAKRIVFLGDSNTYAGGFVSVVESQLIASGIQPRPEIINLGLSSETCSGLSEPAHPFPRPDVHERLARTLNKLRPDVVVACYGMNDGIYYPLAEDRFAAYRTGVDKLIAAVHASGAKLILMTPPPFDPLPLAKQNKLLPEGAAEYSWMQVYEGYDDVMETYAKWIMEQSDRVEMVIDLYTPVTQYMQSRRATDPNFVMSGDGVHVDAEGHRVIGEAIASAWAITPTKLDPERLVLLQKRQALMRDAWLSDVGHLRPGIASGLPIEEATRQAAKLDQEYSAIE